MVDLAHQWNDKPRFAVQRLNHACVCSIQNEHTFNESVHRSRPLTSDLSDWTHVWGITKPNVENLHICRFMLQGCLSNVFFAFDTMFDMWGRVFRYYRIE